MASLRVELRRRDNRTVEVVNRNEIVAARVKRAKDEAENLQKLDGFEAPVDLGAFAASTPHTLEIDVDAALASQQAGTPAASLPALLARLVGPAVAPEFGDDVEVVLAGD
jgi:hypothetical protein